MTANGVLPVSLTSPTPLATPGDGDGRLRAWNDAEPGAASEEILPCNGSEAWAAGLISRRPFTQAEEIFAASDEVWAALSAIDWQQAFDSHPRIGESRAAATAKSLAWSQGEQASANPDEEVRAALVRGNKVYEETFGRIFIVCATGKSAAEMLRLLEARLTNDAVTELQAAVEEQRRITQLRLRKWLLEPAGGR